MNNLLHFINSISGSDCQVEDFNGIEDEDIIEAANVNSNIYVESPVKRKSNPLFGHKILELENTNQNIPSSQHFIKTHPIPAPRSSVGKNSLNSHMVVTKETQNISGVNQPSSSNAEEFESHSISKVGNQTSISEFEAINAEHESIQSLSMDETTDEPFDVSVDVHHKTHKQTDISQSDTDDNDDEGAGTQIFGTTNFISDNDAIECADKFQMSSVINVDSGEDDEYMHDSSQDYRELYSPISASEIRLKKPPPGSKIDNLKNQIEKQVTF